MSSQALWWIFAAEMAGLVVFGLSLNKMMRGASGGAVGAWLLLIPLALVGASALVFLMTSSLAIRTICLAIIALPLLLAVVGMADSSMGERERYETGDKILRGQNLFTTPETRALGSAIYDCDVDRVRALLPTVGNLNQALADNRTALSFAVGRHRGDVQSSEILRLMLKAGADPNATPAEALYQSMFKSEDEVMRMLLEAGADPNALRYDGTPVWWMAIDAEPTRLNRLRMLLDRGANVKMRAGKSGPVAWSIKQGAWAQTLLLIERGADWKHENVATYDTRASSKVFEEYHHHENSASKIPKELRKLKKMYASVQ
jgi:hypothetical protein